MARFLLFLNGAPCCIIPTNNSKNAENCKQNQNLLENITKLLKPRRDCSKRCNIGDGI